MKYYAVIDPQSSGRSEYLRVRLHSKTGPRGRAAAAEPQYRQSGHKVTDEAKNIMRNVQ